MYVHRSEVRRRRRLALALTACKAGVPKISAALRPRGSLTVGSTGDHEEHVRVDIGLKAMRYRRNVDTTDEEVKRRIVCRADGQT